MADAIRHHRHPIWLATVVAKQDLWVNDETAVRAFYEQEAFAAVVAGIEHAAPFRRETVYASLTIQNFESHGERLRPCTAGYDHRQYVESLVRLYQTFSALRTWEEGLP